MAEEHSGETGTIIVGGGQAAMSCAEQLRRGGYAAPISILGEEPYPPYQRPPLSKAYLAGAFERDRLVLRGPEFLEKQAIEVETGARAEAIDRPARQVVLNDGSRRAYDHLVLATGARPRPLPVPGGDGPGVHLLRGIDDVDRLAPVLERARRVVVIGGGFIGLEIAAVLAKQEKGVTVVEASDRLMGRVVAPPMSAFYKQAHEARGVQVRLEAGCTAIERGEADSGLVVRLTDGQGLPVDCVVVGIGVIPNADLAAAAGLSVATAAPGGIHVDGHMRTDDPHILAIGDVAAHENAYAEGRRMRLESVQNAIDQGRTAAATILGQDSPYRAVPWFWSDQYDLKLQTAGLSAGYDRHVVRGNPDQGGFSVLYYRSGRLAAVDSVNAASDHVAARKILGQGASVPPERAGDTTTKLKDLAA